MSVKYKVKSVEEVWSELKARVPKLKGGVFIGDQLVSFTAKEELTDEELNILKMLTGKTFTLEKEK
jgi:hypothetical protein